jgi:hypothetical protein
MPAITDALQARRAVQEPRRPLVGLTPDPQQKLGLLSYSQLLKRDTAAGVRKGDSTTNSTL